VVALACGLGGSATHAEEDSAGPAPQIALDRLLKLPDSLEVRGEIDRRGGATEAEWQARFASANADYAAAEEALAETRAELGELAADSSAWKVSAPGMPIAGNDDAPMDYGLSQKMKRRREDLERAKRRLRELEVEANLAGVPESWGQED
jgi:hypothetical protein